VRVTLIGKDPASNPGGSAAVYRTDRGTWIIQGRLITAPDVLAQLNVRAGETAVEMPDWMVHLIEQEAH